MTVVVREYGECLLTRTDDGLLVERADPEVMIDPELLDEIRAGRSHPDIHVDGNLVTIHGLNRKVIYRVGGLVHYPGRPSVYVWHASWPD